MERPRGVGGGTGEDHDDDDDDDDDDEHRKGRKKGTGGGRIIMWKNDGKLIGSVHPNTKLATKVFRRAWGTASSTFATTASTRCTGTLRTSIARC